MADFNEFYSLNKDSFYYPEPSSVLINNLHLIKGDNLVALDLGCGDGRNAIYLARNNYEVFCFDLSSVAINKIKKLSKDEDLNVHAEVLDVMYLDFEIEKFDLIVASTILDHLDKSDSIELTRRIKSWVKRSGFVYVGVFTTEDPAYSKKTQSQINDLTISETGEFVKTFFDKGELKKIFIDFSTIYYYEGLKEDLSHGKPHHHGLARIFCVKN